MLNYVEDYVSYHITATADLNTKSPGLCVIPGQPVEGGLLRRYVWNHEGRNETAGSPTRGKNASVTRG